MDTTQQIIETVAGDSAPDVTFTITREDGSIVVLTGATVKLRILDPKTGERTNDAHSSCNITDALNGICIYSWAVGGTDCPDPGIYKADLQITYQTGKVETYQLRIDAKPHV